MEGDWIDATDELFALSKSKQIIRKAWGSWRLFCIRMSIWSKPCTLTRSMILKLIPSGTSKKNTRYRKWSKKDKSSNLAHSLSPSLKTYMLMCLDWKGQSCKHNLSSRPSTLSGNSCFTQLPLRLEIVESINRNWGLSLKYQLSWDVHLRASQDLLLSQVR